MKKIYEAYVIIKLKDYFEDKLRENGATMLSRVLVINSNKIGRASCRERV